MIHANDTAPLIEFGEGVTEGNTERVYTDEPIKRPNRAECRHGKHAEASRKAKKKAQAESFAARKAADPRLVRHKF